MAHRKLNVARFHTVPSTELDAVAEQAVSETDAEVAEALVSLFRNRALRLIRNGSSSELRDEAALLNRHLYSPAGREVNRRNPDRHASLRMVAEMIGEASRRTDSIFLSAVLQSHSRYARSIVEMVSRAGSEGLPRQRLLTELMIPSESYLSHILADLEEADVIVRLRRPHTKGVRVVLGQAGRDLLRETLLPEWFMAMMTILTEAVLYRVSPPPAKVAAALEKAAIPSRLLIDHVNELLAKITGKRKPSLRASAPISVASPS
jgi:DNA-binding MarR family transcriptional regulator